ncbi:MAG: DsbA family protein [Silvanigrellaceae bacterium]
MSNFRIGILSIVSFSFLLSPRPSFAAEVDGRQSLFQIDGTTYSSKDLSASDQNRLHEMELNHFKAVEGLARQRYVELKIAPFAKLNDKDHPFAAEEKWLNRKFAPTSTEVDKALETFKDEKQLLQLPVGERGKVLERYLTAQNRSKALTEATDKAIEKGEIKLVLKQPQAPVVEISRSPQPVLGNPKETIRIVEFTDFQCPYCKKLSAITGEVLKKYGAQISWEVRHFPLSFHKQAKDAAAAVYCASLQGKLSDAKKWVFDAQERLAEEKIFAEMSKALSLKVGDFDKCRGDEATAKLIESDVREGERIGVSGTPTVFVNGRRFQGDPQSMDAWDAALKPSLSNRSAGRPL